MTTTARKSPKERSGGTPAKALMKLMGRITRDDADEMIQIINDCCGRVDASEW